MNYYYFPILKTKPSEIRAYKELNEEVKNYIIRKVEELVA